MIKLSQVFHRAAENNLAFTGLEFLQGGEKYSCCAVSVSVYEICEGEGRDIVHKKARAFIEAMGLVPSSSKEFECFRSSEEGFERVQFERYCWLKFLEQLAEEHEADPTLFGDIFESKSTET